MAGVIEATKKLRRITRACDYCHKRSIRCPFPEQGNSGESRCQNCIDFGQPCRFDRIVKRRGAKPRSQKIGSASGSSTADTSVKDNSSEGNATSLSTGNADPGASPSSPEDWRAPQIANQATIVDLVEIYFEIVYPIFPLFHRPTLLRRVSRGEYTSNKYLFAATMAICALVSARAHDRAVFNPHWDIQHLLQTKSESFYAAAVKECGCIGALQSQNHDLMRACVLLAITAIQYGRIREMQTHLGKYHTLVAMDGLQDEANWPKDIGIVETEERRRLFWSVYGLDIYTSIVWHGMVRCREQQSNVSYTTELDDELFDDSGYQQGAESPIVIGPSPGHSATDVRTSSWLSGWNFTIDLYRILEHVLADFRDKKRHRRSFLNDIFGEHTPVPASSIQDSIMSMYSRLPRCFKETQAITCDINRDRYGFQAANITATVQLLRMILFASGGDNIEDRCKIASEVVEAFMCIPMQYLQAISSPLLHHLAGIGSILGSVFDEPLCESGYMQVRVVLLSLAQLLENLDHGIHSTAGAERLRSLVARVDEYMESRRTAIKNGVALDPQQATSPQSSVASRYAPKGPSSMVAASQAHANEAEATDEASFQLPSDFFDEWPGSFDFLRIPENGRSFNLLL